MPYHIAGMDVHKKMLAVVVVNRAAQYDFDPGLSRPRPESRSGSDFKKMRRLCETFRASYRTIA